ncbi:MAG: flagellar hook-length control protein FliK [Propionibacteriales bacterium]|nr:flagellar hook-length control protein FliK [Propionibacteriales bacterium]
MTISPTTSLPPGPPAAAASDGTADPGIAGDFLAAMLQALAPPGAPGPAAGPSAGGSGSTGEFTTSVVNSPDDATEPPVPDVATPDAAALALVVPPAVPGQPVVPPPATSPPTAPGHANVAEGALGTPRGPASDIRMSGDDSRPPGRRPAAATKDTDAPTIPPTGTTGSESAPAVLAVAAGADAGSDAGSPTAPVTGQPAASVTAPAPAATPEPAPAHHVTRQVFPEVTSLVTRGDGTHRITLTLKPEALGEVRVVMTVRDGTVHVRLAAGHEAQQALRDGSSELSRLLEVAGAHESRVVVRDLPAATTSATATTSPDLGTGGQRPQDQHAGTRAHNPAMDGTHDGPRHRRDASGATEPRSDEPVTRTRTAGVDVTM